MKTLPYMNTSAAIGGRETTADGPPPPPDIPDPRPIRRGGPSGPIDSDFPEIIAMFATLLGVLSAAAGVGCALAALSVAPGEPTNVWLGIMDRFLIWTIVFGGLAILVSRMARLEKS